MDEIYPEELKTLGILVVCNISEPTPVAFLNLYEEGDVWVKTQDCEACSLEGRQRCCGNCGFLLSGKCAWHIEDPMRKPFYCILNPIPNKAASYCALEYKCTKGKHKGAVRRVRDRGDILR